MGHLVPEQHNCKDISLHPQVSHGLHDAVTQAVLPKGILLEGCFSSKDLVSSLGDSVTLSGPSLYWF